MDEQRQITMDDLGAFIKKRLRVPVEPVPEMAPVIMRAMEHIKALALEYDEQATVTLEPELAHVNGAAGIVCVCDMLQVGDLAALRDATSTATDFGIIPRTDGRLRIVWGFKGIFRPVKK